MSPVIIGLSALWGMLAYHYQHPVEPPQKISRYAWQKPDSAETAHRWIQNYHEWIQNALNEDFKAHRPSVEPDCGQGAEHNVWFINPSPLTGGSGERFCAIQPNGAVLFPVINELAMGDPKNCAGMVKMLRGEIDKHRTDLSVTVNKTELARKAFWRNTSDACFPLDTGWGEFGVITNGEMHHLSHHYADGQWVKLLFNQSGDYVIRIVNRPQKRWNWDETFSKDVTYTIRVLANDTEPASSPEKPALAPLPDGNKGPGSN